ncbi:MAG: hypothetical protein F6K41_04440 [Symploca sp. SIO3E6]|nr:hypothetical protein [Caldora sp. SIO3E6]
MVFFSSKTLHFYQKIPPELLTYYLLLITYYFKTRVNRLDEASPTYPNATPTSVAKYVYREQ